MPNHSLRISLAEGLEPRKLLAASITLSPKQVLSIIGTDQGETISVLAKPRAIYHVVDGALASDISQFKVKSIVIRALGGDDVIVLQSALSSDVDAGAGNDRITGAHGTVTGGKGNDTISGSDGALDGGAGNDLITARSLNPDFINFLSGDLGNDTLIGTSSNDSITGGNGNDLLVGHQGNDTLDGGLGTDTIEGGGGEDFVSYAGRSESLKISLDGVPNDGAAGENDALSADLEDVFGGDGNDLIVGNDGPNLLLGDSPTTGNGFGIDTIRALGGNDTVYAADGGADPGDGDNLILGGAVDLSARTTPIRVDLHSGSGFFDPFAGTIDTSGEHDTFGGDDHHDLQIFAVGVNVIRLGSGNDILTETSPAENAVLNTVFGNGGNDSISIGGPQIMLLDGGAGNDTLSGGTGNVTLRGGAGADRLISNSPQDVPDFQDGPATTLDYSDHVAAITADLGKNKAGAPGEGDVLVGFFHDVIGSKTGDRLVGSSSNDTLSGGGGNDMISGLAGRDVLGGDDGADSIDAGNGDDILNGGSGNDTLIGGAGDDNFNLDALFYDAVRQNSGNDLMSDQDGNDTFILGFGHDTIFAGNGDDDIRATVDDADIHGGAGTDQVEFDATVDLRLSLDDLPNDGPIGAHGNLHSDIESISSGDGDDLIIGNSADNSLFGNGGNDTILGGDGNDSIDGGDGRDSLSGQTGNDTLTGGHNIDAFFGGDGDDIIDSRDGNAETVNGGAGFDKVHRDYQNPHKDVLQDVEATI